MSEGAQRSGEPVYLTRRGRAVAVVVDPVVSGKLVVDAEDALDRTELALACKEEIVQHQSGARLMANGSHVFPCVPWP